MRGSVAISEASAACVTNLEECLNVGALMKHEWAERRLGDLNLWISTSGSQAKGRASFDHRLASKPEIRAVVSNLLLMLSLTIQKCKRLAVASSEASSSSPAIGGNESDHDAGSQTPGNEHELEQFELSDESSSSLDGDHTDPITSKDDALHIHMRDVEDIVRQLSQITAAVRRSGRGFRLRKADQLFRPEKYEELRIHLKAMLQNGLQRWASEKTASDLIEKWTLTETPQETWSSEIDSYNLTEVQDRLIKCNLIRRHRFIYQQRHSKKMEPSLSAVYDAQATQSEQKQQQDAVGPESAAGDGQSAGLVKSSVVKPANSSVVTGRTDRTGTTATGLSTDFSLQKVELKKAPATPTVISTTVASRDVNYPWPPGVWSKEEKDSSDESDATDASVTDAMAAPSLKEKLRLIEKENPSLTPLKENPDSKDTNVERLRRKEREKMEGNINFKCPCCCQALDSDLKLRVNDHRWRAHIADDLTPYTCIIPSCEQPETMYPTKELWRQHLFKDHLSYVYWRCLACAEKVEFRDEGDFGAHLREEHAGTIPSGNIEQLMSAWKKSAPTEIKACPMCDFPDDQKGEIDKEALLDHIAIELQNFALRALPWADDTGQESSARIESSTEKVSIWMEDMLEDAVASGDFSTSLLNKDWADDGSWKMVQKPSLEPMEYLSDHFSPGKNDYFGDEPVRSSISEGSGASSARAKLDVLKEEEGSLTPDVKSDTDDVSALKSQVDELKAKLDELTEKMRRRTLGTVQRNDELVSSLIARMITVEERLKNYATRQEESSDDMRQDMDDASDLIERVRELQRKEAKMTAQRSDITGGVNSDMDHLSGAVTQPSSPRDSLESAGSAAPPVAGGDYDGLCYGIEKEGPGFVRSWRGDRDDAMWTAARRGNSDVILALLHKGVRPYSTNPAYDHPIYAAAILGHAEAIRLLLEYGADPDSQSEGRYGNAMQAASSGGHTAAVKMLLDRGANVNAQAGGRYGTALQAAVSSGNIETVKLLLDRGADVDAVSSGMHGTALKAACYTGDAWIVEALLHAGADVNKNAGQPGQHSTALQVASCMGHTDVVDSLLERGALVDSAAVKGASDNNHDRLADLLESWRTYGQPEQEARARESPSSNSTRNRDEQMDTHEDGTAMPGRRLLQHLRNDKSIKKQDKRGSW